MSAPGDIHAIASRSEDLIRANALLAKGGHTSAPLAPLAVEIQPTAYCHRVCVFCSHIKRNRNGGRISEALMTSLLDELRYMNVGRIGFSGGGEPISWGLGALTQAISQASRFAATSLTTSGDHLWDRERQQLVREAVPLLAPLELVYVNIPTVDQRSWQDTIKGGLEWREAQALCQALCSLNRSGEIATAFYAVVVLGNYNVDEVQRIDETLLELGFTGIYYKVFKNYEQRNVARLRLDNETLTREIEVRYPAGRSIWLDRLLAQLHTMVDRNGFNPCWANRIQASAIVDPGGDVFPCTPVVGASAHIIGNINTATFREIWADAERRSVVAALDSRAKAGGCPAECREHAFNDRVQREQRSAEAHPGRFE